MTSVHPYAAARLAAPPPVNGFPPPNPSSASATNGLRVNNMLQASLPPTPSAGSSPAASPLLGGPPPGGGGPGGRPTTLDRMPSTLNDFPVATNSALNKAATASSSIYQRCSTLRERLYRVPDFRERFFDSTDSTLAAAQGALSPAIGGPVDGSGASGAGGAGAQTDPVSQVLSVLRLGASLCFLFNQLGHAHQLDVNPQATLSNLKACQRGAAHFIMACKQDLRWPEGDLFAVNELYGQDTNGVVKVVHTVTKLLDLLESQGVLLPPPDEPDPPPQAGPSDERSLVVREILDSERKYMQDLEVLQDYQRQLQMNDILTQDQIHSLFINLNKLADFQRRFLIGVEGNASLPAEQQRFGNLFLQMRLSHVLDPVSELAPLLIKPVQRICKYPLLISQLLKNTPEAYPYYDELKAGLESIMRVTDKVNEEKRRKDNAQAVDELNQRVEDWKGHDISSFGQLLLQETFVVIKSDNEREYNVYLFERIILCCKEVGAVSKKDKKSNSILKRPPSQRISKLQLKGRIFVNNITGASQIHHRSGQYLLEVRWRGDVTEEAFTIKCRTQELLQQWQKAINKAVEEAPTRRRAHHLSSSRRSERSLQSPASQFPPTPMSEYGPSAAHFGSHASEAGSYSGQHLHSSASHYAPSHHGAPGTPHFGFDDDDERYEPSESGRSTPSTRYRGGAAVGATRSLPPAAAEQQRDLPGLPRPRAQTEDSNSNVINQWRTHQQAPLPPTPQGAYGAAGYSQQPPTRGASQSSVGTGADAHSLRSSASSRQLRNKQSTEWGGPGSLTSSPAASYARLPNSNNGGADESTPRVGGGPGVYRQASHGAAPTAQPSAPAMLRNRSASSPNIYAAPGGRFADSPQLPDGAEWQQQQPHGYGHGQMPTSKGAQRPVGGTNSGGTLASATTASGGMKRSSASSSNGTDRSSLTSAHSSGGAFLNGRYGGAAGAMPMPQAYAAGAISPAIPASATAVRVKVFFGEDTFVVVVLDTVPYPELVDKVLKKIRMCGGDKARVDSSALRLRYRDEDGDRILITSEEDVTMAFETARVLSAEKAASASLELTLYASIDA
ncbi:hypothetical protein Rhopal_006865-T1 [Rhodotorula paludigena]|uniref:Uncharacterized protein n=1 Tax=Rhodotorula paludigena TaxID=86838 RepID=A0AAV5GWU4_9BASI|nr:hypothetical protein Rhopal_006865-T1 [Rhodotorula paludigena]